MSGASSATRAAAIFTRRLLAGTRANRRAYATATTALAARASSSNQPQQVPMPPSPGEQRAGAGAAAPAGAGRRRTFSIYRPSRRDELIAAGRDVRIIHMVRHAQVRTCPCLTQMLLPRRSRLPLESEKIKKKDVFNRSQPARVARRGRITWTCPGRASTVTRRTMTRASRPSESSSAKPSRRNPRVSSPRHSWWGLLLCSGFQLPVSVVTTTTTNNRPHFYCACKSEYYIDESKPPHGTLV